MCGIAGISVSRDHRPAASAPGDRDALEIARAALAHRGPDDSGVFEDAGAGIGLAHARLSILDLSPLGHQPMEGPSGEVLVYNGEIYNFRELRAELVATGHQFRGHSDTEVLLRLLLACDGDLDAVLGRLNGIFAFALWDPRLQTLLLARDALGVKPLYYSEQPEFFAFASEIKALLPLVPHTGDVDAAALHRYMSFLWCPGEGTPLKAVRKIMPGEALIVRDGRVERRWTWYRLPVFRGVQPARDDTAASATTLGILRAAVHRQMVADVPLGAFLSGGLDSSAAVALAREVNPEIQCFTIETTGGSEAGIVDDLPYARRVARHLQVPLEIVTIDSGRMAAGLEDMIVRLDEPLADPAPLNVLYISQLARSHGIKVLLSGAGGDDLLAGYRRHRALQAERYWRWLPRSAREALEQSTRRLDQRRTALRRLTKLFDGASLEGDARLVNYFVWARRDDLLPLYSRDLRAAVVDVEAAAEAPMLEFLEPLPPSIPPLERMLALEQRFFLADHNLMYTDKMSMAVGVEVRVPFLDLELVEFAASLSTELKQRGRTGKWVLKKAMEPYLPYDVIYRPKTGFGAPLRRWMRHELRELLGDLLSPDSLRRRGLFEPIPVQELISANDAGRVDASYTLLSLLCIEIWCRRFLDTERRPFPDERAIAP